MKPKTKKNKEKKNFFESSFDFLGRLKFKYSIVYVLLFTVIFLTIYPTFFTKFEERLLSIFKDTNTQISLLLGMAFGFHFGKQTITQAEIPKETMPPPMNNFCANCPNNLNKVNNGSQ